MLKYTVDRHLDIAKKLTKILDNQFEVFGFKFGLDPIVGLIPILGDILPAGISAYLIWIAYKLGLPKEKLLKMVFMTLADIGVGFIPLVGDFVDVAYKSYQRSMDVIDEHLNSFEARVLKGEKIIQ